MIPKKWIPIILSLASISGVGGLGIVDTNTSTDINLINEHITINTEDISDLESNFLEFKAQAETRENSLKNQIDLVGLDFKNYKELLIVDICVNSVILNEKMLSNDNHIVSLLNELRSLHDRQEITIKIMGADLNCFYP